MGRSHVSPIQQPNETTCGPSSLKLSLEIFGHHKPLQHLISLCKTNRNGTSTKNLVYAARKLGYAVEIVEFASLHHLQSALHYPPNQMRAVIVTYLYDLDENKKPHLESGHWAVVSSYLSSKSRIVLLDSASAQKKSYGWLDFRNRWVDYDLKRVRVYQKGKKFKLIKKWQKQLLIVIAKEEEHLPWFKISTSKVFSPMRQYRVS